MSSHAWLMPIKPAGPQYGAAWIIDASWAHPVWHQYALLLYDLTTDVGVEPVIYKEGVTHEFMLFALDPKHPLERNKIYLPGEIHRLSPANIGYQFKADNDKAAEQRMQEVVDLIVAKQVSPDTDFRSQWDALFSDGHSLKE